MLASLFSRIRSRLSWQQRELSRLSRLPRGTASSTALIRPWFETLDGSSFAAQYRHIFMRQTFAFTPASPRPRILDCGANIGTFTVFMKQRFPQSRIVAFEPDPVVFQVLERNVRRCCSIDNVTLVNAAVLDRAASRVAFVADHCDAGHVTTAGDNTATLEVQAVRLRDQLAEPCDLLKLDIEGAEVDVILDCEDALARVPLVFTEYHSYANRPQRLHELLSALTRAGFRLAIESGVVSSQPFQHVESFLGMDMAIDIWAYRDHRAPK